MNTCISGRFAGPLCAALAAGVCITAGAVQQAGAQTGQRVYEEQLRARMDEQIPEARELGLDGGGWFNFALFHFDGQDNRRRTLRLYELRLWGDLSIQGVHRAYVRGLTAYEDWNSGDNPPHGDDWTEPRLERGWYQFDLGQMIRNQTGRQPALRFKARVGRDYAAIGSGLVLSMPLDMVRLSLESDNWELSAFLGKTIHSTSNLDQSPRVAGHQDRCFWGMQWTYTGLDRHQPFVYFLNNQDNTVPRPRDLLQSYEYTSRYVGLGSRGSLGLSDLRYQAEVVGEWGKTYSSGAVSGRDEICAMALDALLEYRFRVPTQPRVMVEYIRGSGDEDRRLSSTSTVGGNRAGTRDNAFNAFGFRDTGIAFAPAVSNLHVYVVGSSFFPLEKLAFFRKMEIGTKAFFYQKAASSGAISDTAASNDAPWVGWEWDVFCDWRITSDVAWTIRYGAFQPGSAFEERECRQFLYTGVTLSF